MKRIFWPILCLLALCLPILADGKRGEADAIEREVHALINRKRIASGKPPLAWNEAISKIAREHSADMASGRVRFGHGGFDSRSDKINASTGRITAIAENVAMASDAEEAVALWWKSRGHKKNLLGSYGQTGIGAVKKGGSWYFTQIFIAR